MKVLVKIALIAIAAAVAVWVGAEIAARTYLHHAISDGWPVPSGRLDAVRKVFPTGATTAAALALEAAARPIGIDLLPRAGRAKTSPPPAWPAWKSLEDDTKKFIASRLTMGMRMPAPPPSPVAAFLEANDPHIQRIEAVLMSSPAPQWPIALKKGLDAPLPNLLGHLSIARLLIASALNHDTQNNAEAAWRDLEAASRLPDGLFRRPELISHLIALVETTMITGAMRQLAGAPPPWASQWPAEDVVARMNEAATAEAWSLYEPFNTSPSTDLFRSFLGSDTRSSRGGRVLSFILSPYLRASAANTAMAHRKLLREYASLPPCSQLIATKSAQQLIPGWNTFGRVLLTSESLASSYRKANLLLAQLEGTRLILAARRIKQSSGMWPSTTPTVQSRCSAPLWTCIRADSDEWSAVTTTPLSTSGIPGTLELPQRFWEQ